MVVVYVAAGIETETPASCSMSGIPDKTPVPVTKVWFIVVIVRYVVPPETVPVPLPVPVRMI